MACHHADVFIAGGGMVGMTLGLALAQGGLDVAVADPLKPEQMMAGAFDGRVSAIAYASARMLRALGVWQELESFAQPINEILVTDAALGARPSPFSLHFDSSEIGEPLGSIAENRHIRMALFHAAEKSPRLKCLYGVAANGLRVEEKRSVAMLTDSSTVEARLVVSAEGRAAQLRELMDIRAIAWDYGQTGIVATVEHEKPHNGVAYEHFLPGGPFAILPLPGNRSSLVWTEKAHLAPAILALNDEDFNAEMNRRFGAHLGAARVSGPRWSYPLKFHLARAMVRPRFALVGDAAHGIHPIAGQGVNLGFKDVAALAEIVLDTARLGLDFGEEMHLRRYERWRRFDNAALALGMDALNRLFSNDIAPLRFLRDAGLGAVDAIAPMRRFFMRMAGGDAGKLPRLLKGEAA